MNIGELKIEALKLMFVNNGENINVDNSDEVSIIKRLDILANNEMYGSYLNAMDGAINRALARISVKKILPKKSYQLLQNGSGESLIMYNLLNLIPDFYAIHRIVFNGTNGNFNGNVGYINGGYGNIMLPYASGSYSIIYTPKAQYISSSDSPAKQLNMPTELAMAIPYFVKAEIYEEDEPSLSAQARNVFEQLLEEYRGLQDEDILPSQSSIKRIFRS